MKEGDNIFKLVYTPGGLVFSSQGISVASFCFLCGFLWFPMLGKETLVQTDWENVESSQSQGKEKRMPVAEVWNKKMNSLSLDED